MSALDLPVKRPVAVAMIFLAVVLLGVVAWQRMPVELFPVIAGNSLYVDFNRPGSEPLVVEREILLPLQARVSGLPLVTETSGEVRGSFGRFEVRFERGSDLKVRELELQRIAAELVRTQPRDTQINVRSSDTSAFASFVMMVHVLGGESADKNALHDLVEELVVPRIAAVSGVSQAVTYGGAPRQLTVTVDPDRAAALGVTTDEVTQSVGRNVSQLRFLGGLEAESGRTAVMIDGRPPGLVTLGEARVRDDRPVLLRHVSELRFGAGREESLFRVNTQPAVGLVVFQEEGANLVRLGRSLRDRLDELGDQLRPLGLELVIGFDAAEMVEDQIGHLARLGLSGFAIALVVLFLFLRQWRAVAVVGVAVPVSLLAALAMLYLMGQSLNLITLFGLALAVGLLVDNGVVVYEAVQRQLELGAEAGVAVRKGLGRTVRAVVAASLTTAVVFLPLALIEFEDAIVRELIKVVAMSILLPLAASLAVAVGLVPLLAHRLAAPAALRRLDRARQRREASGGLRAPDRARLLFSGLVAGALRRPSGWLAGTAIAVLVTAIVALPWVALSSTSEPSEADTVRMEVSLPGGRGSLQAVSGAMAQLEHALVELDGVEKVEATVLEEGGSLTVQLVDSDQRPPGLNAAKVRSVARRAAKEAGGKGSRGMQVLRPGEGSGRGGGKGGGGGGFEEALSGGPAEVILSGPESEPLMRLARDVSALLKGMPQVESAWFSTAPGLEELWVEPNRRAFEAFGLTLDDVLPVLQLAGREGQRLATGYVLPNGRELPVQVERRGAREQSGGRRDLAALRVQTEAGVVPIMALASLRRMPAPSVIVHHNGRREMKVLYRLSDDVPETGPGRIAVEEQVRAAVRSVGRPRGFTVEAAEQEETTSWFRRIMVPAVLLLYLVLAMTFESLSLPILVLLALPLTLLGATWALVLAGMPLGMMALLGALALFGLTVNPAILLVDRMQQKVLGGGWSAGAAAFASVRERTRPVLMTTATTVAGLWPLALATGAENEIWPPFATIVIGGLVTSTLLTLLIIPVGYVLLRRLDELFTRVGPWLVLSWLGVTVAVMTSLIVSDLLSSLLWQVTTTILVGGSLLAIAVSLFGRRELVEPDCSSGPPKLEVRCLRKVYGLPGPVRRALRAPLDFAQKVLAQGGRAFNASEARDRLLPLALGAAGLGYLASRLQSVGWRLLFWMAAAAVVSRGLVELRRARGKADAVGRVERGGVESVAAIAVPWICLGLFTYFVILAPRLVGEGSDGWFFWPGLVGAVLALVQLARSSARRQAEGELARRATRGPLRNPRTLWRRWTRRLAGLDLPTDPMLALAGVNFEIERGMVGVLGPNGAGKTTLLRQVTGILDPTRGTITLGGVRLSEVRHVLARWVGYLPQDAGLPGTLTARQYLGYFAALYDLPHEVQKERVESLLEEVGLAERADEAIKSLSGGMRQRVAVARTLLRLPPVIVVDEPTVGLDPRERIRFRNLLGRLARDRIVLFSTHVVEDVAVACERVLVLARGRLLFDGEPSELAEVARGRVWEVRHEAGTELEPPEGSILAEETPAVDGSSLLRLLMEERPSESARPLDAVLEDGYLWLLNRPAIAGPAS